ncbi:type IV toxin-antitoxin system AbiEi family antitoxin domain-containing protein [Sphingobium sp. H39-3-25]|uniref:type IV toxin-antitoxin system AbiEi family antitoxin domain-containing protein n=1 Tax=Sphingobium arseniciresistens TaxID=3030834 RepID=UPI0023B9D190|nr:type IV toxin-antitoxin system AbiEi family antitoxin domain-containing protein [Sphingobium arseniciresistens]
MKVARTDKLRSLLDAWEPHTVATSPHLKALGLTAQDLQNYTASQWLVSLGRGAFKRPMETVTWQGALYSVQSQLKLPVHVGALTALEMTGNSHYVRFGESRVYLFSPLHVVLPAWFQTHWGEEVRHMQSKLLPNEPGLTEQRTPEGYPLTAATPERAILELLHLAPKEFDLVEAGQIVEGMTSLRPKLMQSLLEACASVKVRRLFLYLAERADLPVMRHLKVEQIDLGSGDRSLVKMGRYVPKYRLLLPRELVSRGN